MKRFTIVFLIMFVMGFILIHQNGSANSLSPLKQGMNLYKQGKYELSLVFLEKAFKENPLNYRLYFYLGNVYNHKKMFKKSIEAYKRGIEISPVQQKKEFLYNLARSYQGDKQYKEALGLYSKLEKESSKYPEIHLYRGMIYYNLQNKSAVIKSWETYLAQAPNGPQYQSIRKAIDIIKDDKFRWPVEVAKGNREKDKKIVEDEDNADKKPTEEEIKKAKEKLVKELKEKEKAEANKGVDDSVENAKIDSENIEVKGQEKKEGVEYDEIER